MTGNLGRNQAQALQPILQGEKTTTKIIMSGVGLEGLPTCNPKLKYTHAVTHEATTLKDPGPLPIAPEFQANSYMQRLNCQKFHLSEYVHIAAEPQFIKMLKWIILWQYWLVEFYKQSRLPNVIPFSLSVHTPIPWDDSLDSTYLWKSEYLRFDSRAAASHRQTEALASIIFFIFVVYSHRKFPNRA